MNSIKKVVNNIKMPSLKQFNLSVDGSGFLYNKSLLYLIFAISFGNFMLEMISGDIYFVVVYLLIGFLTTFFNKNMIVVLLVSTIFANILKYGAHSVEGFEDSDENVLDNHHDNDDLENAVPVNLKPDKKRRHSSESDSDSESDDEEEEEEEDASSVKKKSKKKEAYTDRELNNMKYTETVKMLDNQKLLLKNMKDFKPFIDTIQGIAKSFTKSPEKAE